MYSNLKLLYENIVNGNLVIGKYTLVKNLPLEGYDYNKYKNDKSILSSVTRKNLDILEKKAGAIFSKIYKVDKSQGRRAYSTYVLGKLTNHRWEELNGKEFIWARQEGKHPASGSTDVFFDDRKFTGTSFIRYISKSTTKVGNLYKVEDEKENTVTYYADEDLRIISRHDGPAYVEYYSNGKPRNERWVVNNVTTRDTKEGPAEISYNKSGKIIEYNYMVNGQMHRPEEEGPASEQGIGGSRHHIFYYQNGEVHRINGPALIGAGFQQIYINGIELGTINTTTDRFIKGFGFFV